MAYKVLYRKYRPSVFSDVVGQPQVTVTLKNELKAGRISHAYLFTGSRGTGKTTCAKILAKAVNCLHLNEGDPCGECETCTGLDNGQILDVVEIDAASNNGVDSVRQIIEESSLTPASAKYRVYIIDEVHMLSVAAFNALLKTLEEPPEHVIFILATTEVHRLLPTILSRCQRFDFKRIAPEDIAGRLEWVCEQENATIDHEAALLIARVADGGMRDALSILDQCLGRSDHVDIKTVNDTTGTADKSYLYDLTEAIRNSDASSALEIINNLHENSKDMSRLCEEMAEHFRELMLIKTMRKPAALLKVSEAELEELTKQALALNLSVIIHSIDTFRMAMDKMRFSNQRTEMEMAFIRLCSPELDSTPEALIRRIEALEKGAVRAPQVSELRTAVEKVEAEKKTTETETVKSRPQSQKTAEELSVGAVFYREWPEIVERIKMVIPSIGHSFTGTKAYVNGNFMLIEASEMAFKLLRAQDNRDKVRNVIADVTGKRYSVGPYKRPDGVQSTDENDKPDPLEALAKRFEDAGIEINYE